VLFGMNFFAPTIEQLGGRAGPEQWRFQAQHARRVANARPWEALPMWAKLPADLQELITLALTPDPAARPAPVELLGGAFMARALADGHLERFYLYCMLKAAGELTVVAAPQLEAPEGTQTTADDNVTAAAGGTGAAGDARAAAAESARGAEQRVGGRAWRGRGWLATGVWADGCLSAAIVQAGAARWVRAARRASAAGTAGPCSAHPLSAGCLMRAWETAAADVLRPQCLLTLRLLFLTSTPPPGQRAGARAS
jgi:hypothetical protein